MSVRDAAAGAAVFRYSTSRRRGASDCDDPVALISITDGADIRLDALHLPKLEVHIPTIQTSGVAPRSRHGRLRAMPS